MYRLVLLVLCGYLVAALGLSAFGLLSFSPLALAYSTAVLVIVSWVTNTATAKLLGIAANKESVYITALILALIITPPAAGEYIVSLKFLIAAGVLSEVSKYVINIGKKHIFNPAALAIVITSYTLGQSASWWVGTASMLGFVLIGGLLITRKVQRFDAAIAFTITVAVIIVGFTLGTGHTSLYFKQLILDSPLVFFATIMLTEPLTMPPTADGRIGYGILVGWLFAPQTHFGTLYFSPELSLLVGNVFSYILSPKRRYVLKLSEKSQAATGVYDFAFTSDRPFSFRPGQYMEWTLGHKNPDNRGNRRYLTIASSPTEKEILLGVKFYEQSSSFKKRLKELSAGDAIVGGQLAGDFVLPKDPTKKLVFVAGGIGITPFRSMVKYLIDKQEKRSVTVLYSNRLAEEIAYKDIFDQAQQIGIKTVYTLTDKQTIPADWFGYRGYFTEDIIKREVPDFLERMFYISGSHVMVKGMTHTLHSLGVSRSHIKTDFFPGLA